MTVSGGWEREWYKIVFRSKFHRTILLFKPCSCINTDNIQAYLKTLFVLFSLKFFKVENIYYLHYILCLKQTLDVQYVVGFKIGKKKDQYKLQIIPHHQII